jgi:glycine dehydrogenase subunit 1
MFTPHTEPEIEEMLRVIGVGKLEDLFNDVPEAHRFPQLDLPPVLTEMEALKQLQDLASANATAQEMVSFLGAGAYNHYVPAAVDSILRRGEFLTSYTPYQPEVSQGTLQAIFEYQSMIAALTGMEACNASHYDGATATAEAGIMAYANFRGTRKKFVISPAVHPEYRAVLRTYMSAHEDVQIVGDEPEVDPLLQPDQLAPLIDLDTAMVVVQYPDFFGRIFDYTALAKSAHESEALFVVVVNPTALALFKAPGEFGADIGGRRAAAGNPGFIWWAFPWNFCFEKRIRP